MPLNKETETKRFPGLSLHPSLISLALGSSSKLHPVHAESCFRLVLVVSQHWYVHVKESIAERH